MERFYFRIPFLPIVLFLGFISFLPPAGKPRVLVFAKTAGFHHESIPDGIAAFTKLGKANKFDGDTTTKSEKLTEATLKKCAAIAFLYTTGNFGVHQKASEAVPLLGYQEPLLI